ncbi:MAG TPA: TRAM domain-containing protein, partial [Nonomuraea sp.]|nr:TRAM domain-containing protein [Nonomuraea sp.]
TADRGLIGVAGVEGVRCLDVGLLADSLRPELVPGEHVQLRISRQGRDAGQGVGYLADGTMVVVSDGAAHLGEEVGAEVVTSVPTSKGRLYFATLMG